MDLFMKFTFSKFAKSALYEAINMNLSKQEAILMGEGSL